ncbi:beta/alpha barrel domain-containing protein [Geomesophilobacter sediminis]|uniref:Lipoprotein n=1 Tax=Geomesophilobacter sediminis TaxID=2798584 RepID=A0A8J7M1E6_9BACT|nr:hypothetical protein [Geomesophilobacter sediminis]MBJ6726915.1 hypothetical protein [Geomesophilobacter sediminis]
MIKSSYRLLRVILPLTLLGALLLAGGCATTKTYTGDLPPILAQDELLRPYQKVADLEVRRERMGAPSDISPEDYAWGYDALRREAARIGADAVMFPQLSVETEHYILFPSSEMKAKGVAIKFR